MQSLYNKINKYMQTYKQYLKMHKTHKTFHNPIIQPKFIPLDPSKIIRDKYKHFNE